MALEYKDIVSFYTHHNYYRDGVSKGLKILPTPTSALLMQNNKMIVRETSVGVRILQKTRNGVPFFPNEANSYFFGLYLRDGHARSFLNITDLSDGVLDYNGKRLPFFTNTTQAAEDLSYKLLNGAKPKRFNFQLPVPSSEAGPANLLVKDADDNIVDVVFDLDGNPQPKPYPVAKDQNDEFHISLDFSRLPEGRYKFTTTATGTVEEEYIIDEDLYRSKPFGVLQFDYDPGTSLERYDLEFERRTNFWKYYIVNKSGIDLGTYDLEIEDAVGASGVYDAFTFDPVPPPGSQPYHLVGGIDTVVYIAKSGAGLDPIPFYEDPKTKLNLIKNDGVTPDTIMTNLPNPSAEGLSKGVGLDTSEVYIYV